MKYLFAITIFCCCLFLGCSPEPIHEPIHASVLDDLTDPDMARLTYQGIRQVYLEDPHGYGAKSFRYRTIVDQDFGEVVSFALASDNPKTSTPEDQKERNHPFFTDVRSVLSKQRPEPTHARSHILVPLGQELNRLGNFPGRRILFLTSNCFENSDVMSVYHDRITENTYTRIEEASKLEDITGVVVVVLHHPQASEAQLFSDITGMLKTVLERHGARVFIFTSEDEYLSEMKIDKRSTHEG